MFDSQLITMTWKILPTKRLQNSVATSILWEIQLIFSIQQQVEIWAHWKRKLFDKCINFEGGSDDWAKSIGIKYSYTVELADTGNHGFVLPASFIRPVCEDFFPALEVFVEKVATIKV